MAHGDSADASIWKTHWEGDRTMAWSAEVAAEGAVSILAEWIPERDVALEVLDAVLAALFDEGEPACPSVIDYRKIRINEINYYVRR